MPTPASPLAPADLELLAAWGAGDVQAGAQLFARHYSSIFQFFAIRLGDDCEDLVQATFLGCLECLPRYRRDGSFRTLLFAIARNKLLKHLRERYRAAKYVDPLVDSVAASVDSVTSVIAATQQRERLMQALRRLPIDTQTAIELHYWHGLKLNEIAEVLQMPVNTVKTRVARGRRQLEVELHVFA